MVILVDANIVLDVLLKREPYRTNAEVILSKCAGRQIIGYLAAHTIPNVFYTQTSHLNKCLCTLKIQS